MIDLPRLALSVMQPWAWLVVNDLKDVENRDWKPWNPGLKMRGEFAVHAGQRVDGEANDALRAGLHPVTGRPFVPHLPLPRRWETGGMVGAVEIVDAVTSHSSDWFVGQRALVLRKGRTHPFIPVAGQLGFFDWRGRIIGGERAAPMASQGSLL